MYQTFTRRTLLFSSIGFLLNGCLASPVITNAYSVAKTELFGHPELMLKRSAISNLPYASMAAKIGKGPQVLLLLARRQGKEDHWISGQDRSVITLRGGRVIKTFGFPENLKKTTNLGMDPVNRMLHKLSKSSQSMQNTRYLDLDLGSHYGLVIDSVFHNHGHRKVRIAELDFDTILISEYNRARTLNWQFENLYWVDPADGFVWKSRQVIGRSLPPVYFSVLKPPA